MARRPPRDGRAARSAAVDASSNAGAAQPTSLGTPMPVDRSRPGRCSSATARPRSRCRRVDAAVARHAADGGAVRRVRRQHGARHGKGGAAIGDARAARPLGAVRRAGRRAQPAREGRDGERERRGRVRGVRRPRRAAGERAARRGAAGRDARDAHREAVRCAYGRTGARAGTSGGRALRSPHPLARAACDAQFARRCRCTRRSR